MGGTGADLDEVVLPPLTVGEDRARSETLSRLIDAGTRTVDAVLSRNWLVLVALLGVAALLRLPGLDARGQFDFDQGTQMLALRSFVRDGIVPLLGPLTSVGNFHHGAFSYYLLLPAALLSGAEPNAVVLEIALLGIGAVAAAWWAGVVIGGRLVGLLVGLLAAVSPASITSSTFIWNPNPVDLFAAVAIGAAWKGHRDGSGRWWVLAIGSAFMIGQLQIVELLIMPVIVGLLLVDLRRAVVRGSGDRVRALVRGLAGGLLVGLVLNVPLILSELQTGFAETRGILAYLAGGETAGQLDLIERVAVVAFRVVGWPFVGVITEVPVLASLEVAIVACLIVWLAVRGRGATSEPGRWLGLALLWGILSLSAAASSLSHITIGLPNDHYHAFLNVVVFLLLVLAGVSLVHRDPARASTLPLDRAAAIVMAALFVAQVAVSISRQPLPDPAGGWPAVQQGGERIVSVVGTTPVFLGSVPLREPPDAIAFGVVHAGGQVTPALPTRFVVVGCDRLFVANINDVCGGPAEARYLPGIIGDAARFARLIERFDLSPRESISIYDLQPGG